MKKGLLVFALLAGTFAASAQVSFGIRIGPPPPPRVVAVRPVVPGPGYTWVDGYWYPVNNRYVWHDGYWTRPPYDGAAWVGPRHENGQYYAGYWNGNHGRYEHDHRWDRGHDRDYGHDRDRDHDRDHDRH